MAQLRRAVLLLLVAIHVSCGGGRGGGDAVPALPDPVLQSIDVALDGLGGTTYEIHGQHFPGDAEATYFVRFTSPNAPLFDDCSGHEITAMVEWISDDVLRGTAPTTHVLADRDAYVTVEFLSGAISSRMPIATFLGTPDAAQDQDENGIRDGCDPNTYDFETDAVGARPTEVTHRGLPTGFEVADVGGDRVAKYLGASTGSADRLDRLDGDHSHQNTTVYVDWDDTNSVGSIELWSEGSFSDYAGSGLIVQIRDGLIYFFERIWRQVPSVVGPALPADGRMRIRLIKGAGNTSAVHIDVRNGDRWNEDYALFPVADDRWFRGRATVLSEYSAGQRGVKRITVVHERPTMPLSIFETPESLMSWKLFQRDPNDVATIPIAGHVRLQGPGAVEARIVHSDNGVVLPGYDFADHRQAVPSSPEGRNFHMDLSGVPVGGNYDIQVRLLDQAEVLLTQVGVTDIAVGDVYICAGQSNMSGYSGSLIDPSTPIPQVHRYHNNARWDQALEPVDASSFQTDRISFENPLHSLALPFAKSMYQSTDVPVALVPTSLGGTNLHTQWQRNETAPAWRAGLYGSMLHRSRAACGAQSPAGFLWFQGESDALGARTTAQYKTDLEQLIDSVRTDLGAPNLPAIVAQLGTFASANLDLWLPVQEAQRKVALEDAHVALVTTVDAPRSDAIHFNVPGYKLIGRRFAESARVLRHGHVIDPLVELVSATPGATVDTIDLTYDAPVTGGDASLFSVSDDSGAATVTAIQANGSVITLTLDRALDSSATVDYGRAVTPAAAWVVDSNGTPVPCFHAVAVN